MPLHTADALILRTYKLGEADRIVVFLTDDRGKRRGVAKGARRPRSRFAGGLEPLTHARLAYLERERRDLVRLNYAEPVCSPLSSSNADALAHVGYFAELIDEWAQEADPNATLFRLGASVIEALAADVPVAPVARYFEYWLLRLQGVYPSIVKCQQCGGDLGAGGASFSVPQGMLRCARCATSDEGTALSADAVAFLRASATVAPGALGGVPLSSRAERELAVAHRRLIAMHLDKELKSARVVRELASEYAASAPPAEEGRGSSARSPIKI